MVDGGYTGYRLSESIFIQTLLQGYFSEPRAMFLCNDGDGHTGEFVYIKDEREEQEYLGLCEVQVFPKMSKYVLL